MEAVEAVVEAVEAVVEAVEVELEEWVEVDGALAPAGHQSQGEDMAVPGRRAFLDHRPFQGQVPAGPAEWFLIGTSEGGILKDLK
ncbi:MAG: hypothetical protein WB586_14825 [Chthoniobacterales bacterium]